MDVDRIIDDLIQWLAKDGELESLADMAIQPDTSLVEEGVLDSMKILQLINWLEATYEIKVGVEEMLPTSFETPQAIAEMVMRLRPS